MSPNFSWLNFITNALNLASNEPDNPDILLQFLGQLTGQRLARVESNVGGVLSSDSDLPQPKHQSNTDQKAESEDGMNEEEDDSSSFHLCSSGNYAVGSLAIHDNADSARFPQGNLPPYVVEDPKFRLSWTMMTYGFDTKKNNDKIEYQCCMGIYKCPREGCKFVQNAVVAPRKGRVNGAKPANAKGSGVCTDHKLQLEHVPCSATCTVYRNNSSVTIHHYGIHKHARPSEKVSKEALARLENIMNINNNAKPVQILQGTSTREAASNIHPGLNNLDRLSYYMKELK